MGEKRTAERHNESEQPRFRARLPLDPRGLSREVAAGYVGVSPSLFSAMVEDGRMPRPRVANARRIWDRHELDAAIDALPHDGETPGTNEWDSVL
ncbi:helix-turn-helix transcriptional regulator [Lichenibacterium dinghuense]|uniref:helix-turn-helix transcriptional regulator n=1 Tax=Lichenibacterium dinghuense TaxID=2895977 RepID=UPI001F328C05|nr:hypothetical protein [Lichenibacterium sp. 6Y81]